MRRRRCQSNDCDTDASSVQPNISTTLTTQPEPSTSRSGVTIHRTRRRTTTTTAFVVALVSLGNVACIAFAHPPPPQAPPPLASTPSPPPPTPTPRELAAIAVADEAMAAGDSLRRLFEHLDSAPCNTTLETPLIRALLNRSLARHEAKQSQVLFIAEIVAKYPHIVSSKMPLNATLTASPLAMPDDRGPAHVLFASCSDDGERHWTPISVFATSVANSFLETNLPQLHIDACSDVAAAPCDTEKCSFTMHGGLVVYARSCCDSTARFCRPDWRSLHTAFHIVSAIFALAAFIMIPMVMRERRRQQEARGWALMELFFLGAFALYALPLLDLAGVDWPSCVLAVWLREVGFTLFYGSILLKIYRNMQEYRVRKAHHVVVVRERDMLKWLSYGMAITLLSLMFWTLGAWHTANLLASQWPQCFFYKWSAAWPILELLVLLYGVRLCYKARSSSWIERYQFTAAVCLELLVNTGTLLARYLLQDATSSDMLFLVAVARLHLTISVNIAAIITPKFLSVSDKKTNIQSSTVQVNADSSRRTLTMVGAASSARAHPSLAKLRDNLINGTIDFAEVPISDMNTEDIRAELKRVYTQLRMYKVASIYNENPHIISKRKGAKKTVDRAAKNRRISIPAATQSPKMKRVEEEEKSDLTVESAPHNVYLLSTNKIQLNSNELSVRV